MTYIDSTLVEFERADIEAVPPSLLRRQADRLEAFHYELYDSYTRGGKYVVRYVYYTLRKLGRLTRLQLGRQFRAIGPAAGCATPDEARAAGSGGKAFVAYAYGTPETDGKTDGEGVAAVQGTDGKPGAGDGTEVPRPEAVFSDDPSTPEGKRLDGLKKAVFYAFRKKALLLVTRTGALIENPLFYSIVGEYPVEIGSTDFPWLCRKNLKLMQAMTLYRLLNR